MGWGDGKEIGGAGLGLVLSRLCSSLCFPANTQPWTLAASLNLQETEAKEGRKDKGHVPKQTPTTYRPSTLAYCPLGFQLGEGKEGGGEKRSLELAQSLSCSFPNTEGQ